MGSSEKLKEFRPLPRHQLLLNAILLEGEPAARAWREWQDTAGLGRIDHASQRLIPMVHQKSGDLELTREEAEICKGVYLHTWYKNSNFLQKLKPVIDAFHSQNIKVMPVKGLALTLFCLDDLGLRPMSDFDILVPGDQKAPARRIMESQGWTPGFLAPHGQAFSSGNFECDLHWHLLQEHCRADSDDDYWKAAAPAMVQDMNLYRLCPADMLLHVCVHGAWWNPTPAIRWIVDAMVVIDTAEATPEGMDWSRLLEQTRKRRMVLPMLRAMTYLKNEFNAEIPDPIFESLMQERVGRLEKALFRIKTTPTRDRSALGAFWLCCEEYRQMVASNGSTANPVGFMKFLKKRWHIKSLWQLPLRSVQEIRRRL